MLAITSSFNSTTYTLTVTSDDNIVITASGDNVHVNGADPDTGILPAANVKHMIVAGGANTGLIDLSAVDSTEFTTMDDAQISMSTTSSVALTMKGSDFSDTITGTSAADTIYGNGGDDFLISNAGDDTLDGGDGNDTLTGYDGNDMLYGGTGNDSLYGNLGDDWLDGGDGDDLLDGAEGNDHLEGGANDDTYRFAGSNSLGTDALDESSGGGTDTLSFSGLSFGSGIELDLGWTGTAHEVIDVNDKSLHLTFSGAMGQIENATGTTYADSLRGNALGNALYGNGGDDFLIGNAGNDTLDGGDGNDSLTGYDGNDMLDGGDGNDTLTGYDGNDMLYGGGGNDSLYGNLGDDWLDGGDGDDLLDGAEGNDYLKGGANDDTYRFAGSNSLGTDALDESSGGGTDTLSFSGLSFGSGIELDLGWTGTAHEVIDVNDKSLHLTFSGAMGQIENATGTTYADSLRGNALGNALYGNGGDDFLIGNAGNDTLDGGDGNDSLEGGANDDTYRFAGSNSLGTDELVEATGEGTDTLDFSGLSFGSGIELDLSWTGTSHLVIDENNKSLHLNFSGAVNQIENAIGTVDADTLSGNAASNELYGEGGADWLYGNQGDDLLYGGDGNDSLYGGDGNDTLSGNGGDDTLYGDAGNNTMVLDGGGGSITGGYAGNDVTTFTSGTGTSTGYDFRNFDLTAQSVTLNDVRIDHYYNVDATAITLDGDIIAPSTVTPGDRFTLVNNVAGNALTSIFTNASSVAVGTLAFVAEEDATAHDVVVMLDEEDFGDGISVDEQFIYIDHPHNEQFPRFAAAPTIWAIDDGGSWFDPDTWSAGRVPTTNDVVFIPPDIDVNYDGQSAAEIKAIDIWGSLLFAHDDDTALLVGTLTVLPLGTLQIGTAANPIGAAHTAALTIADLALETGGADPHDPKQYGTGLLAFGTVDMHGTPHTETWLELSAGL